MLIRDRFRNGIHGVKKCPCTDVGSDHNPVVGNLILRLKKLQRKRTTAVDISKHQHLYNQIEVRDIVKIRIF